MSIWIPLCYLPPSMLAHVRQQLISRRDLPLKSSNSELEHPSRKLSTSQQPQVGNHIFIPVSDAVSNIAESSVGNHHHVQTRFTSQLPAVCFRFLDLTNPDHSFSGEGTQDNPILLD